ncbi:hypothetical protein F5B22DRAFT_622645 [Xylaria bambusicola]|uniref:uncharacterized protein n=1 Tax=Xylaria bambusicola TaxID=326684 RepID=UPI0020084D95|nr:uncharacterized protein F5B22DRAFT_622645 [Xylaria bambusicola]KAI0506781.1 hypothetical protein F5B22DRAFT_622645 [Xylaria bambusicola]
MDYTSIATPERCYADFCLIPVRFRARTTTYHHRHRIQALQDSIQSHIYSSPRRPASPI